MNQHRVLPGEYFVTDDPDIDIITVLGSCVATCIRDIKIGVGGMNHFMLPSSDCGTWGKDSASLRYGNFAMEKLINEILIRGGTKNNLEIKVFGGANALKNGAMIGWNNADFVEQYLKFEKLPISASHLRSIHPRRIQYNVISGKVFMLELKRATDNIGTDEQYYSKAMEQHIEEGSIELFDD